MCDLTICKTFHLCLLDQLLRQTLEAVLFNTRLNLREIFNLLQEPHVNLRDIEDGTQWDAHLDRIIYNEQTVR